MKERLWPGEADKAIALRQAIFSQTLPILLINSNNNRPQLGVVRAR